MDKLTYSEYRRCKDILIIDLHNDYSIIAIKIWDKDKKLYNVEFRITENTVEKWLPIYELDTVIFDEDYKTINYSVLNYVRKLFYDNFFDYYIAEYEYELKCFDMADELLEEERLGKH